MSRFLLTPVAVSDLREIAGFVAEDSPANAVKLLQALEDAMHILAKRPRLGHRRDDLADESLRVFVVHSIALIYRPETRPLQIVRVLHGGRDIGAIMGRVER
ncbi:MAG: type II toxin-antitoxin system RelE/ParE family toxin [Phycisphaerales bacterium]|nr:type II toxin-antitoxin system RelE/ParE family toxin [Phycisphaerales bacterium]